MKAVGLYKHLPIEDPQSLVDLDFQDPIILQDLTEKREKLKMIGGSVNQYKSVRWSGMVRKN